MNQTLAAALPDVSRLSVEQQREFLIDVQLAASEARVDDALTSLAEVHEQWAKFVAD